MIGKFGALTLSKVNEPRMPAAVCVSGGMSERSRVVIEDAARHAADVLELEALTIRVARRVRGASRRLMATASIHGIEVRRAATRWSPDDLQVLIFEEAAHHKLFTLGVDDGFTSLLGALVHEAFATWFSFDQWTQRDPTRVSRIITMPLPPILTDAESGYRLGELVGVATAGSADARKRLNVWYEDPLAERGLKATTQDVERMIDSAVSPVECANRLAEFYERLRPTIVGG